MAFDSVGPSGMKWTMDAYPEPGGVQLGPTPVEALVGSLAACTAMDVVSILKKKRQEVESYRLEVEYTRGPEGEWPRPILQATVRHIVKGNVDREALARAIELSDEKYCTVAATLRSGPKIVSEWSVEA